MAYSTEDKERILNEIFEDIRTEGLTLRKSLAKKKEGKDRPASDTFFEWIEADEQKAKQYARAIKEKQDSKFEEIQEIADDDKDIYYFDSEGNKKVDMGAVQRKRLQIDARKWQLSKENPKKYGEKVDLTSDGEKLSAPTFQIVLDSAEELEEIPIKKEKKSPFDL